jgi:biotin carboxylase
MHLLRFNEDVLACYPGFSGVTHHEVFMAADGRLYFCEIAARPGGGGTSDVFELQTGVDLFEFCVRSQLPALDARYHRRAVDRSFTAFGYAMLYTLAGQELVVPSHDYIRRVRRLWAIEDAAIRPRSWADASVTLSVVGRSREDVLERLTVSAVQALASAA